MKVKNKKKIQKKGEERPGVKVKNKKEIRKRGRRRDKE